MNCNPIIIYTFNYDKSSNRKLSNVRPSTQSTLQLPNPSQPLPPSCPRTVESSFLVQYTNDPLLPLLWVKNSSSSLFNGRWGMGSCHYTPRPPRPSPTWPEQNRAQCRICVVLYHINIVTAAAHFKQFQFRTEKNFYCRFVIEEGNWVITNTPNGWCALILFPPRHPLLLLLLLSLTTATTELLLCFGGKIIAKAKVGWGGREFEE